MELTIDLESFVTRTPPPGYAGPINGPFKWAGVGDPPGGIWVTDGKTPVEPIPVTLRPLDIPDYNPKTYAPPEHPKVEKVKASDIGILDSITEYIYQLIYT